MKSIKQQRKSEIDCEIFKTFQYWLLLEDVISLHFTSSSVYNTPAKHDSVNVFVRALLKEDDRNEIFEAI